MGNSSGILPLEAVALFDKVPGSLPIFQAFHDKVMALDNVAFKVGKTQISYRNKYAFTFAWPPIQRMKGRKGVYIVITFGLPSRLQHPRIAEAVEPYPNRWTHHVIVADVGELDYELMGWVKQAYDFSLIK